MHLVQSMAYVGQQPWHGLGNQLMRNESVDVWAERAGMNWRIESSEVRFVTGKAGIGAIHAFPDQKVLYRSDTKAPLSVVSARYQVVQPLEILDFYRDLTEVGGFELETAGVLKAGRKFWALAKTGQTGSLKGKDKVDGYLLLAHRLRRHAGNNRAIHLGARGLQQHARHCARQQHGGRQSTAPQPIRRPGGQATAGHRDLVMGCLHGPYQGLGRAQSHRVGRRGLLSARADLSGDRYQ